MTDPRDGEARDETETAALHEGQVPDESGGDVGAAEHEAGASGASGVPLRKAQQGGMALDEYAVIGEYLAQKVDGCTCAPGPNGEHEPHCGWEPLATPGEYVSIPVPPSPELIEKAMGVWGSHEMTSHSRTATRGLVVSERAFDAHRLGAVLRALGEACSCGAPLPWRDFEARFERWCHVLCGDLRQEDAVECARSSCKNPVVHPQTWCSDNCHTSWLREWWRLTA